MVLLFRDMGAEERQSAAKKTFSLRYGLLRQKKKKKKGESNNLGIFIFLFFPLPVASGMQGSYIGMVIMVGPKVS